MRKSVSTRQICLFLQTNADKVLPTDKETGRQNFKDLYATPKAKLFQNTNPPSQRGGKQLRIKDS